MTKPANPFRAQGVADADRAQTGARFSQFAVARLFERAARLTPSPMSVKADRRPDPKSPAWAAQWSIPISRPKAVMTERPLAVDCRAVNARAIVGVSDQVIIIEKHDGVALLTLSRPAARRR